MNRIKWRPSQQAQTRARVKRHMPVTASYTQTYHINFSQCLYKHKRKWLALITCNKKMDPCRWKKNKRCHIWFACWAWDIRCRDFNAGTTGDILANLTILIRLMKEATAIIALWGLHYITEELDVTSVTKPFAWQRSRSIFLLMIQTRLA